VWRSRAARPGSMCSAAAAPATAGVPLSPALATSGALACSPAVPPVWPCTLDWQRAPQPSGNCCALTRQDLSWTARFPFTYVQAKCDMPSIPVPKSHCSRSSVCTACDCQRSRHASSRRLSRPKRRPLPSPPKRWSMPSEGPSCPVPPLSLLSLGPLCLLRPGVHHWKSLSRSMLAAAPLYKVAPYGHAHNRDPKQRRRTFAKG
jgi:hypothetical protein